jgi:hypothetical protein
MRRPASAGYRMNPIMSYFDHLVLILSRGQRGRKKGGRRRDYGRSECQFDGEICLGLPAGLVIEPSVRWDLLPRLFGPIPGFWYLQSGCSIVASLPLATFLL